jgi:DNA polymerase III subunit epsilon
VVLDLETTGLHAERGDRIIEIAAIRYDCDGERSVHSLVDPECPVPADGQRIHGIDATMVTGQPRFVEIWPRVQELLEGAVLVAHKADADLAFLKAECARAGLAAPAPLAVLDTLLLARSVFGLFHCRLPALAERLGLAHPTPHRAMPDVLAAREVYLAMLGALERDRALSVGELIALGRSLSRGSPERLAILAALRLAFAEGRSVCIDYTSAAGGALSTRRTITITRLRPPYVEAHCHLREEPRVFKLSRIRKVWGEEPG